MIIDIAALQTLPEVDATATGLAKPKPKPCTGFTKIICVAPTCKITKVQLSD